ncbi:Fet3 ferroxidase [Leucogyrophana mollusca]|uniref:Fet3 ferroxidase n=1 Tax=Leucogyrophana mollusca TaxID=85980 RepID=A0ACB8B7B5_9AGAM|nr:Fet3 ferroxidase [Leucogyrophana mollusca]
MRWYRRVLPALVIASPALAGIQEIWWKITYVENANPDGLFDRRVIGVNGTWPPPPISMNSVDSLLIHVTNGLDVPTSLHHHGIFFNSTSWMDGTVGVAQCGIPPGQTFDYAVPVNMSEQWGTYWVHSHDRGQYVDGLRAPLTLHPADEAYQYDEEYTVILSDWYHQEHQLLLNQYINIANPGGIEPVPDSALIYFAQNTTYLSPIGGISPSPVTSAVGFNENATLPFVPGRTYRLRVINMSAFAAFFFWIDGHDMRIIEGDGTDVHEMPMGVLDISAAQRYSVLVTARNDSSSNWAVHANMDTTAFDKVPSNFQPNVTASIAYTPGSPVTTSSPTPQYTEMNDTALVPLVAIPQPPVTQSIELEVAFATMTDGTNRGMINGIVYNSPLVPAILSELSLGENATIQEAYGPTSFVLNHLDVIDIVLKNTDTMKHPFHLHGHNFQIVNRAQQYNSTDPVLNPPLIEGQANPMRRDTVVVSPGGSVTLRFIADNPGAWFFHCHMEWHLEAGLAVQFIEAPLVAQERAVGRVPPFLYDQCAAQGIPSSGNAAGHASTTDLSGLPLGPYQQILGWRPKGIWAMTGCVVTAVAGMLTVIWYSFGGDVSEEEMEAEARALIEDKAKRRRFFGLLPRSMP